MCCLQLRSVGCPGQQSACLGCHADRPAGLEQSQPEGRSPLLVTNGLLVQSESGTLAAEMLPYKKNNNNKDMSD